MNSSNGALSVLTHNCSKKNTVCAGTQDQSSLFHILWGWEPRAVDLGIQILSNGAFTQRPGSELYMFTEYIGRPEGGILSLVLIQITAMRVGVGLQSLPDLIWCQKPPDETAGFPPRQSLDSNLL